MLSPTRLFSTPWTIAHQAPLSRGFSGQGYWSDKDPRLLIHDSEKMLPLLLPLPLLTHTHTHRAIFLKKSRLLSLKFAKITNLKIWGFPGYSVVKNPLANAEDVSSIPGLGRSPREGNSNLLQYSSWEIPWTKEPGRLQSTRLQNSWTQLSN